MSQPDGQFKAHNADAKTESTLETVTYEEEAGAN
jgi:hypothetical protein